MKFSEFYKAESDNKLLILIYLQTEVTMSSLVEKVSGGIVIETSQVVSQEVKGPTGYFKPTGLLIQGKGPRKRNSLDPAVPGTPGQPEGPEGLHDHTQ